MFLLASCNFPLLLIINEFETAVVEIALSSLIEDELIMLITVLVKIVPAVVANWTLSPTFNSVKNCVLKPVTSEDEALMEIL